MKKQSNKIFIYGKHALIEALENTPEVISKVFLARDQRDPALLKAIKDAGITHSELGGKGQKNTKEKEVHQGVIGQISLEKLVKPYREFIDSQKIDDDTSLLLLGEIQDPHNVGAVIRSAAAFGISGVIIPTHNQAPITGTVVKVSAGMVFRIPIISVSNVNATIRDLKDRGFWIYGLEGDAKQNVTDEKYDKPTVFVLGNESTGIREKTRELCDILISVPTHSKCESLNAAASTAIALYAWSTQHKNALEN